MLWSLAGAGLPLLVGLWAIPILISGLGKERFGLLTIIWMGIGYFSFFDLGIGRALTKLVSESKAKGDLESTGRLIAVGLPLMMALGAAAAILVACLTPWLVDRLLKIAGELRGEATVSLLILAVTLPFVVSSAGQIGILQAHQRFRAITMVRVPMGVANFVGPLLVLPLSRSLVATTGVIALTRLVAWTIYWRMCRGYRPDSTSLSRIRDSRREIKQLLSFGGWITISNIVGPMMVYFDRFFVGALAGLSAVTYYATPYELISRISIIPVAFSEVMFPAFSATLAGDSSRARKIFIGACSAQIGILLPLIAFIILFAPEGLSLWLGDDFSHKSAPVLRLLALGVFVNSFGRLPSAMLQAHSRPDITAKLHLTELPIYLATVYGLTTHMGITGTAIAWLFRVSLDALMLFCLAARTIPVLRNILLQGLALIVIAALFLFTLGSVEAILHKALAFGILALATVVTCGMVLMRGRRMTWPRF